MADITFIILNSNEGGSDTGTWFTDEYTPGANKNILLVTYTLQIALAPPAPIIPVVSGNNLTWVTVASQLFAHAGVDRARLSVFQAVGPAPITGQTQISYNRSTLRHATTVLEWGNTDIGNLGANFIVGTPPQNQDDPGTFSPSIILPAAEDPANSSVGILAYGNPNPGITPGVGITPIDVNPTSEGGGIQIQWTQQPVTLMDWTLSNEADAQAQIGLELRNAIPAPPPAGPQQFGRPAFISGNLIT